MLVKVIDLVCRGSLRFWLKLRERGATFAEGMVPKPARAICCGLSVASSASRMAACCWPVPEGVKLMARVQELCGVTTVGQLLVWLKSGDPATLIADRVSEP